MAHTGQVLGGGPRRGVLREGQLTLLASELVSLLGSRTPNSEKCLHLYLCFINTYSNYMMYYSPDTMPALIHTSEPKIIK